MNFLLDANMPRSTAALLRSLGHDVEDVREVLPNGAEDTLVAAYARKSSRVLVTRDFDFASIRNYPPQDYAGIVVLELPEDVAAPQINRALESFVRNEEFLKRLPGRLAIVESWRVRFRPA